MDSLSSALASASAMQQEMNNLAIQTTVAKKQLGVQKMMGEAMVGLIAQAAGGGGSSVQTPGKAIGLGSQIDVAG